MFLDEGFSREGVSILFESNPTESAPTSSTENIIPKELIAWVVLMICLRSPWILIAKLNMLEFNLFDFRYKMFTLHDFQPHLDLAQYLQ